MINRSPFRFLLALHFLICLDAGAAVLHVDLNNPNPTPPYTSWATAAIRIQDAVDAAIPGDTVLVTNGVYASGGKALHGTMTNRVAVDKPLTVLSVNGPEQTVISGAPSFIGGTGDGAIRCVLLVNNAVLKGFTLTNGHTRSLGDAVTERSGGGAWCEPGAVIRNSIVVGNSAHGEGGGVYRGTLVNSKVTRNSADYGGGVYGGLLYHCTVVTNVVTSRALGAGTARCTNYNSIVYYNSYTFPANYSESTFYSSCTAPLPMDGQGNITDEPGFVDLEGGILRLQCGSPCIDAGSDLSALIDDDLRGHPRPVDGNGDDLALFDIGAYERSAAFDAHDIGIRAGFTRFASHFVVPFVAQIDGCASNFWWDFGDGSVVSNRHELEYAWTTPGTYPVTLTAQFGLSGVMGTATSMVQVVDATSYVNAANPTPSFPYGSWGTAATNIQDAVNAGDVLGRLVIVTNGIYRHGGLAVHGTMTNRATLTNGVKLQSVNGPAHTLIEGSPAPGGGAGNGAVRGLYVDKHSVVIGFTITNGHTLKSSHVDTRLHNGGGVWCEPGAMITNCLIVGNVAGFAGGGVSGNYPGFGKYSGQVYGSYIVGNSAYKAGGAAYAMLANCVVLSNQLYTAGGGGGAIYSELRNCTVAGNSAGFGGGVHGGTLFNTIVYYNSGGNWSGIGTAFSNSCTTPLPAGSGNIANKPRFVNLSLGDVRLQDDSPCINAGSDVLAVGNADLDGNPRFAGGTVDIGAYEFQSPTSMLSYAWAQQYGLPTDGSADLADTDGDGANNLQEWEADTDPKNVLSVLRMVGVTNTAPGLSVMWQGVPTRNYWLERASNLGATSFFQPVATHIAGEAGVNSFHDTSATNAGPYFYRVGVQ